MHLRNFGVEHLYRSHPSSHSFPHTHIYGYPQGQTSRLFLELSSSIISFICPLSCILVYNHLIFIPNSDKNFHGVHHLDSTNLWTSEEDGLLCALTQEDILLPFSGKSSTPSVLYSLTHSFINWQQSQN